MASPSTILSADRGRAIATALGILCVLVAVQVGLLVRIMIKPGTSPAVATTGAVIPLTPPPVTVTISPPPVGQLAPTPPLPSVPAPVAGQGFGPPPIGSFQAPSSMPVAPPQPPLVSQPLPAAPKPVPAATAPTKSADPAANMSLAELIDLAKQVRSLGDMQGALEVLKRADLQFPAAPEVMAETAQCYEQMGLTDKANTLWKQLTSMDATKSAGFGDLAKRRLNAPAALTSSATPAFSGDFSSKLLSLGACLANRDPSTANGEKVVLRIPILRQGNTTVDPAQVDIDVYFFDRVNGEKVAQTIADEPLSAWGAPPVDWSGVGEEPLEVTYFLPALTPGEIAAHGRRSYHGYVVRLYYQHKLQDVAAEPRDLLDFGARTPQSVPGGANPLLPPVSN